MTVISRINERIKKEKDYSESNRGFDIDWSQIKIEELSDEEKISEPWINKRQLAENFILGCGLMRTYYEFLKSLPENDDVLGEMVIIKDSYYVDGDRPEDE